MEIVQEKITQLTKKVVDCDIETMQDKDAVSLYKEIAPMLLDVLIGLNRTVGSMSERNSQLSDEIKRLEKTIQILKIENENLKNIQQ